MRPYLLLLRPSNSRVVRLYSDSVKALYGEGPYHLAPEYRQYTMPYEDWKDAPKDQRIEHAKKFFSAKPRALPRPREPGPNLPAVDLDGATPSTVTTPKHLSNTAQEYSIPEECISQTTMESVFRKAKLLINENGAIMRAASNDERMISVKSKDGGDPLIVKPLSKKSNVFQCVCITYKALSICLDTVAVAEEQGLLFDYLLALRQKLPRAKSKGRGDVNLTAAVEANLRCSERGMKENEVRKAARKKRQRTKDSVSSGFSTSLGEYPLSNQSTWQWAAPVNTQPSQRPQHSATGFTTSSETSTTSERQWKQYLQPTAADLTSAPDISTAASREWEQYLQPAAAGLTTASDTSRAASREWEQYLQPAAAGLAAVPDTSRAASRQWQEELSASVGGTQWHSGMSPHPYTLCMLPNAVQKCYGCGADFAPKYRHAPNNIIVKHVDRRFKGRDSHTSQLIFNPDFTNNLLSPCLRSYTAKEPSFRRSCIRIMEQLRGSDGWAKRCLGKMWFACDFHLNEHIALITYCIYFFFFLIFCYSIHKDRAINDNPEQVFF